MRNSSVRDSRCCGTWKKKNELFRKSELGDVHTHKYVPIYGTDLRMVFLDEFLSRSWNISTRSSKSNSKNDFS